MGKNTRGTTSSSGEYRSIQNFLGPTNSIEDAVYIPIGANEIGDYMTIFPIKTLCSCLINLEDIGTPDWINSIPSESASM
jgi:hypothetical protein